MGSSAKVNIMQIFKLFIYKLHLKWVQKRKLVRTLLTSDTGVDEDADKVELLNNKTQALQKQLVHEQEVADNNRAAENEVRERVMYLERDLKAEK